jgi:hypothetical protein
MPTLPHLRVWIIIAQIVLLKEDIIRGSLFNYRNTSPGRVWKVGSELQFTTSLPLDPVNPLDPVPCRNIVFCLREALTFHKLVSKVFAPLQWLAHRCLGLCFLT